MKCVYIIVYGDCNNSRVTQQEQITCEKSSPLFKVFRRSQHEYGIEPDYYFQYERVSFFGEFLHLINLCLEEIYSI